MEMDLCKGVIATKELDVSTSLRVYQNPSWWTRVHKSQDRRRSQSSNEEIRGWDGSLWLTLRRQSGTVPGEETVRGSKMFEAPRRNQRVKMKRDWNLKMQRSIRKKTEGKDPKPENKRWVKRWGEKRSTGITFLTKRAWEQILVIESLQIPLS